MKRLPLSLRVVIAVSLGAAVGALFGTAPVVGSFGTAQLGELGLLVIRALKALAVPLVLFAVIDGLVSTDLSLKNGARLLRICLTNAAIALVIGLTLVNVLKPGAASREQLAPLLSAGPAHATPAAASLSPLKTIEGLVPESLVAPFAANAVLPVVLLALVLGLALRRQAGTPEGQAVATFVRGGLELFKQVLEWVVALVPLAVFGIVAQVVGRAGLQVFLALAPFVGVVLAGFLLHGLGTYGLAAWLLGGKSPRELFRGGADAILTGFSTNSSLATMPLTLKCLTEKLGVSAASARLSACIGTNLNNDGITLYEAMAALFVAQALGMDLGLGQQAVVVGAALLAGMGIAGIPEAGLIMLPLVLTAAGLPPASAALALTLLLPVDWLLARFRSALNVTSDLVVAVLLDADRAPGTAQAPAPAFR